VSRLRKRLGDDADNPVRIKTVRGKGYLFSRDDWG
jgi:two-component system OmpR family response regulator/two-component system response regulator RstA